MFYCKNYTTGKYIAYVPNEKEFDTSEQAWQASKNHEDKAFKDSLDPQKNALRKFQLAIANNRTIWKNVRNNVSMKPALLGGPALVTTEEFNNLKEQIRQQSWE